MHGDAIQDSGTIVIGLNQWQSNARYIAGGASNERRGFCLAFCLLDRPKHALLDYIFGVACERRRPGEFMR